MGPRAAVAWVGMLRLHRSSASLHSGSAQHDYPRMSGSPLLAKSARPFDSAQGKSGGTRDYVLGTTCRLLSTEKVPGTLLARMLAVSLSPWLSTTPSSVTWPFLTIIRMGFWTPSAYFS